MLVLRRGGGLDAGAAGGRGPDRHGRCRPPQPRQRAGRHRRRCRPGPARRRRWPRPCAASAPTRPTIPAAACCARSAASRSWSTSPTIRTAWRPSASSWRAIPASRRLVLLGQAGDRTDAEIRALAARGLGAAARPDRDQGDGELPARPRAAGEIPALLRAGARPARAPRPRPIAVEDSETAGVRSAFAWAQPGRPAGPAEPCRPGADAGLPRPASRRTAEWRPGDPLPPS